MSIRTRIETKLTQALEPTRLKIVDDSEKHAGHSGYQPGGETHFRVEIVSARFTGMARVQRQRLVYELLTEELTERIHALQLKTLSPEEA